MTESSDAIWLTKEDLRWCENLRLKEELIRNKISKEAEEMMNSFSQREGVDLRGYDINWETGEAKIRTDDQKAKKKPEGGEDGGITN